MVCSSWEAQGNRSKRSTLPALVGWSLLETRHDRELQILEFHDSVICFLFLADQASKLQNVGFHNGPLCPDLDEASSSWVRLPPRPLAWAGP